MEQAMRTQAPCKHPQVTGVTIAGVTDTLARQSSCREGASLPVPAGSHRCCLPDRLRRGRGSAQQREG